MQAKRRSRASRAARDRRLLRRRGVRHRRIDPPAARRRGRRARRARPRTRNAQVALYQSGESITWSATDAIGMGLNLDVDHVAFAPTVSSTVTNFADSTPPNCPGRGPRRSRTRDGSFGTTGRCPPFDAETRAGAREPQLRAGQASAVAQFGSRFRVARAPCSLARRFNKCMLARRETGVRRARKA